MNSKYLLLLFFTVSFSEITSAQCDPPVIIYLDDYSDVSCYGLSDGFLLIHVEGGTEPYTYNWTSGGNDTLESNLSKGNYTVIVSDQFGCSDTATYFIDEPEAVQVSFEFNDASCHGNNDGSITVHATGGVGGFSYQWLTEPPQTSSTINNLYAGNYTVVVTDQNNCMDTSTATIVEPDSIIISIDKTDVNCYGGDNGILFIDANGGSSPYYYSLNNAMFQTSNVFAGLEQGEYFITVKDFNNCTVFDSVTISEPNPIEISINSSKDVQCFGQNTGSIEFHVTGGILPYEYYLDFNSTDTLIYDLIAGNYQIIVSDSAGCSETLNFEINQPDSIYIDVPTTDTIYFGESLQIISEYYSNSSSPEFIWEPEDFIDCNNCPDPSLSPINSTKYIVTLVDNGVCYATDTISVIVIPDKKLFIPNAFTPNNDGLNDEFYVYTMGIKDFFIQIFDKWGNQVFESRDINDGWNGESKGQKLSVDTYLYAVSVIYLDGEIIQEKGVINLIR